MVKSYAAKAMDFAIKCGYIQNNPVNLIDKPKSRKKSQANKEEVRNFYSHGQLIKFLKCMEQKQEQNIKQLNRNNLFLVMKIMTSYSLRKQENGLNIY